jgi:hypothetical protein
MDTRSNQPSEPSGSEPGSFAVETVKRLLLDPADNYASDDVLGQSRTFSLHLNRGLNSEIRADRRGR